MFCPSCGYEEKQETQYCRSCGADLETVRTAVISPERVSGSVEGAKAEVGRAIARRIENIGSAKDLAHVAEEVLPEVEKFLESPAEKRLRRIRYGSLISFIGLGAAIGFVIVALFNDPEVLAIAAFGLVTMMIGIAMVINGYFFTVPQEGLDESRVGFDVGRPPSVTGRGETNELLMPPSARSEVGSVTENTTRTLDEKIPVTRGQDPGEQSG